MIDLCFTGAAPARGRFRGRLRALSVALLAVAAMTAMPAAQAGLFDDEEARKAIVDLRSRIKETDDSAKARASELAQTTTQLAEVVQALRRSLLDLNNQLEAMRGDLAKLRGADEQLLRDVADVQKRQKDIGQGLDERLRKLEPQKVALDGTDFLVEPEEKRMYEEAMTAMRGGDFEKSVNTLGNFQRRFAGSGYSDSVRFWLGNALYGKRDYKEAITAFRAFVTGAPQHPRAAEALLALANSQVEAKDRVGARKTIDELMKAYPASDAAQAGKERLAALK
jgi:tol-pal system protein YbgF